MTLTSILLREPRFALAALLLAGSLSLAGCVAPSPRERAWPEPAGSPTPAWVYQPPSWKRLDRIEAWLESGDVRNHPELVPAAHLELGEGRLRYAREEGAELPPGTLALRLSKAEQSFLSVIDEPLATREQKDRARRGLVDVKGVTPRVASSPVEAAASEVLARSQWGARPPVLSRLTPNEGGYHRITVHHSAKDTAELGRVSSNEVRETIRKIQRYHMNEKGFGDIGYHFLIDPKGRVWVGRSLRYQGAHSGGRNNVGNIGICLLGHFDHENPDSPALEALERLLASLRQTNGIPRERVYGHQELTATQCPGRSLMAWVDRYRGAHHASTR